MFGRLMSGSRVRAPQGSLIKTRRMIINKPFNFQRLNNCSFASLVRSGDEYLVKLGTYKPV